jgi:DNA-binding PadR family transcriptional regulator
MDKANSRPSSRELEVLRLLQSKGSGMYGLEIVERSGGSIGRASIYKYLGRLEEKGYVTRKVPATVDYPGLPRPTYRINGLGEAVLAAQEMVRMHRAAVQS